MFHTDGKVNTDLKFDPEEFTQHYFYFIKLVPHVFVDEIESDEKSSYSYSLKHNKKKADGNEHPKVVCIIDYAPVKMIMTKS